MIKDSKLIGTKLPMPYGWREFSPLDLFDFPMAKSLNKDDLIPKIDGSPYVTRTVDNNGVNMLIDLSMVADEYVNAGNEFSFGLLGLEAFYQKCPYVAGQFVRRFVPKFDMNETLAMYFKTLIDKLKPELQATSIKGYANILQKPLWVLPVTEDGQPDYGWISSYIRELENQRIRELDTYLQVTGLSDKILSDEEKVLLDKWRQHEKFGGGTLLTKRFHVGDLFDIMSTHALNYDLLQSNGDYPYVVRSAQNNGIREFMNYDTAFLNEGNVITLGIDTASYFYQDSDFFAGVKVKSLRLKHHELNPRIAMFLIPLLQKKAGDYGYAGGKAFKTAELVEVLIELPVTADDTPDYDFMQTFIRVQEKLVMQRLDKFRQLQIDTTKAVI